MSTFAVLFEFELKLTPYFPWGLYIQFQRRFFQLVASFEREKILFDYTSARFKGPIVSVGTSSGSFSFTARFYKGSLKVSKLRDRLDHKIAKLGKARARNVRNELDFCPKIIKKSSSSARSKFGLGWEPFSASKARLELARTRSVTFSKSLRSLGSWNSRLVPTLPIVQ